MKTRNQIFLDKHIAKPLVYLMGFIVRIIDLLLRKHQNLDTEFKTICVCKFKGIGSIVQSTPMLSAIKEKYPNARLFYISTHANKGILEIIDLIDNVITIDDSSFFNLFISTSKALLKLMRLRCDIYIDLEIYSDFSSLFSILSLSKNRMGFHLRSRAFRTSIYSHTLFFNQRMPISKVYLQAAELIGCDIENMNLYPLNKNINKVKNEFGDYIVINVNASDLRLERRWGINNFAALIKAIIDKYPKYTVFLIGNKKERAYTETITTEINSSRVKNIAGRTNIDELISLIADSKLMISNDTGPMHIAFSTKTPTICLFGPCSPEQYEMNENAHVFYKQIFCSPCVHEFDISPCKGDNKCMQKIMVEEVSEKAKEVLAK